MSIGKTSASNRKRRGAEVIGAAQFLCSVPDSQSRYAEERLLFTLALACMNPCECYLAWYIRD